MRLRRIGVSVCGVVLALAVVRGGLAGAEAEEKSPFAAADAQILSEIREHSEAAANLEYLSDSIGARLTGSPQLKQANDWTRDMFAKYGACCYGTGCVLRCEGEKRFREISRQAEGRDRDLSGSGKFVASEAG